MADNIIKRIVKMFLDKESAKQTQDDANAVAEGIDNAWKSMASKVAGYLGVAFLTTKVVALGRAAVKEAMDSEAAWADLKGTIDATGASFDKLEDRIRMTADAFQDATIHDDDAFAQSLSRVVSLTGDAEASLNNMGLVANVAAQFFKGELEPAANLVAKAMNGNVAALGKMGIKAKDAQSALDILAQRSLGAASREAATFGGQLKQMDEAWNDVLKDLGNAIIQSGGATNAVSVLRAAIKTLGEWVVANKDTIREWVTNGVMFAIDAADVFIRAVVGMANILKGGFMTAIGLASQGIAKLIEGWIAVREIEDKIREKLGLDNTERNKFTERLRENAKALNEWGKAAKDSGIADVAKGIDRLSTRMFSSEDFKGVKGPGAFTPELNTRPTVGKNVVTDSSEAVRKALEAFNKDAATAANMAQILGERFNTTDAEIDRTTKLLAVLAAEGVDPASIGMGDLSARLTDLVTNIKPVEDATKALADTLRSDLFMATLDSASGLDKMKIQQAALQKAMQSLLTAGIKPEDKALKDLAARYKDVTEAIKEQTTVMQIQAAAADFLADALGTALQGGLHEAATQKAKQNAIEAAEMLVRAGAFALFGDFPHASAALILAGQFAGIAAAWGILAASSHGSSGGGSGSAQIPSSGSGGGSAGSDISSSRSSSRDAASRSEQPSAQVSVYLVGPGFDALNPEVQKVVFGARQEAEERYGPNARVRVTRA